MEIFYSENVIGGICRLEGDEAAHCVKVLRHRTGDIINVIDGQGTLMKCSILEASPKSASCQVLESLPLWGAHPYNLALAVCPTKNADRYEWFAEKACEIGVDTIVPLIGERSERKVFKTDRLCRILLSATKQSLKAANPQAGLVAPVSYEDYLAFATGPSPYGKSAPLFYDYLAGTSPADPEDSLRVHIAMQADGTPVVSWTPDTPALRATRAYALWGAPGLDSARWARTDAQRPDAGFCATNRFFRISVGLPAAR